MIFARHLLDECLDSKVPRVCRVEVVLRQMKSISGASIRSSVAPCHCLLRPLVHRSLETVGFGLVVLQILTLVIALVRRTLECLGMIPAPVMNKS